MYIPISTFIGQRWFPRGEFICTIKCPHPQVLFFLGSFVRSGSKCCLQQSCSFMDLNKDVPPGDAKVGGKGKETQWGCRMKQNWLQKPIGGTWQSIWASACTDLQQLCLLQLARSCLEGMFAEREQNSPPKSPLSTQCFPMSMSMHLHMHTYIQIHACIYRHIYL